MTTFALCSCTLPMRESPATVADWADGAPPWMTLAAGLSCTESMTVLHAMHRTGARPIISASSWGLNRSMASLRARDLNTSSPLCLSHNVPTNPSRFSFSAPVTSSRPLTTSSFEVSIISMTVSVEGRNSGCPSHCSKLSVAFSEALVLQFDGLLQFGIDLLLLRHADSSRPGPADLPAYLFHGLLEDLNLLAMFI